MGILTEQVGNGLEALAGKFKDRLFNWMVDLAARGVYKALESAEPGAIDAIKEGIADLQANPHLLPGIKKLLGASVETGNWLNVVGGIGTLIVQAFGTLLGGSEPLANLMRYDQDKIFKTSRLDPASVITAIRRDRATYEKYLEDLTEQGWSDDRIGALEFVTRAYPTLRDVIGFFAHEVFEPDMVSKYGLTSELPEYEGTLFEKLGVDRNITMDYWIDHWQHASWVQVVEMLHRGLVNEDDVYEWFRLVEIPPFWRDLLIQSAYTWPTRVDVRRFYDLQTIDDGRLREIYMGMGYRGKNLEDYILWTKIYVRLPDLLARWKNGWINLEEVKAKLVSYGMTETAAQEVIETKVKAIEPTGTAEGKELTKSEIYKGVKQGLLTFDQGIDLLMQLDYTSEQAEYLLTTNVTVLTGSPSMYTEFKDMTDKYRRSVGLEVKPMSEALKAAAKELEQRTKDLELLKDDLKKYRGEIIEVEPYPEEVSKQLTEKEAAVAQAELQVQYARTNYETELAKWRATQ